MSHPKYTHLDWRTGNERIFWQDLAEFLEPKAKKNMSYFFPISATTKLGDFVSVEFDKPDIVQYPGMLKCMLLIWKEAASGENTTQPFLSDP